RLGSRYTTHQGAFTAAWPHLVVGVFPMTGSTLPRLAACDDDRPSRRPYLIGAALTALFLALLALVATGHTQAWDDAVSLQVHRFATPGFILVMQAFTFLGTHAGTAPLIVAVLLVLVIRQRYDLALGFALLVVGG